MNILQVSVRASEGGAAGVALNINNRLNSGGEGFISKFMYGYSKGGRPSHLEESDSSLFSISKRSFVIQSFLVNRLIGISLIPSFGEQLKSVRDLIDWADVIHLHVIHSFFIHEWQFLDLLIHSGKKVVWTMHDHWLVTGRCAFLDGCRAWKTGCGNCLSMDNYPPAKLDFSRVIRVKKMNYVQRLVKSGAMFVSPSKHLAKDFSDCYPEANVVVINNGLEKEVELKINKYVNERTENGDRIRVLVIAHDLSYQGKTDPDVVRSVARLPNVDMVFVGKNNPFSDVCSEDHGYISNRDDLYSVIVSCDVMLFTSQVDNYPLVIGECLCLGTAVIATKSPAAREILSSIGGGVYEPFMIPGALSDGKVLEKAFGVKTAKELSEKALNIFSGEVMLEKYCELYV